MINQWLQITESLFQLCYLTFDFHSSIGSGFGSDVTQTRSQRWFKHITIAHHHSTVVSVVSFWMHKQTSALQPYPENNLIISCFAMLGLLLLCQMWGHKVGIILLHYFPSRMWLLPDSSLYDLLIFLYLMCSGQIRWLASSVRKDVLLCNSVHQLVVYCVIAGTRSIEMLCDCNWNPYRVMIKALTYVQMYGLWSLTVDYLVVFVAGSHVDFLELYFLVFNLKLCFTLD